MNKKKLALILLLSVMAVLCAVFVRIDARNMVFCPGRGEHAAVTIKLNAYEEKIYPYYSSREDTYYFFLPSMLCDHVIYNDSFDADMVIDHRRIGKFGAFAWEEGKTYLFTYGEEDVKVRFMVSSALPALFITTEEGHTRLLDEDKTHTEPGWMDAIEADGSVSYSGSLMIHGRGNSSFSTFLKKPYNIELNKAAGILGMNRDKDWCLLANAWDYSYMNNKLALDMAAGAGFQYVPEAEYADIYFNGNYYGMCRTRNMPTSISTGIITGFTWWRKKQKSARKKSASQTWKRKTNGPTRVRICWKRRNLIPESSAGSGWKTCLPILRADTGLRRITGSLPIIQTGSFPTAISRLISAQPSGSGLRNMPMKGKSHISAAW